MLVHGFLCPVTTVAPPHRTEGKNPRLSRKDAAYGPFSPVGHGHLHAIRPQTGLWGVVRVRWHEAWRPAGWRLDGHGGGVRKGWFLGVSHAPRVVETDNAGLLRSVPLRPRPARLPDLGTKARED